MQRYLETRTATAQSPAASADLDRHLLSRQHLGKVVVVCDKPFGTISVVRKYWFKMSRGLQKERASTLNAEKILQLTYDITRMQHMDFVTKPFAESPESDVFFVTPEELTSLPASCFSLYILAAPSPQALNRALSELPHRALVVDYTHDPIVMSAPLLPKSELDDLLPKYWRAVAEFLNEHNINIQQVAQNMHHAEQVDEAIDVILNTGSQFLRVADEFLEALRLAQPLLSTPSDQQLYDVLSIITRRVYALTPGTLSQQFARSLGDDELSLHDVATEKWAPVLAT